MRKGRDIVRVPYRIAKVGPLQVDALGVGRALVQLLFSALVNVCLRVWGEGNVCFAYVQGE